MRDAALVDGESGSNRDRLMRSYFRRSGQVRTFVFRIPMLRSLKSCRGDVKRRRSLLVATDCSLWRWYEGHDGPLREPNCGFVSVGRDGYCGGAASNGFVADAIPEGLRDVPLFRSLVSCLLTHGVPRAANVAVGIVSRCDRPYGISGAGYGPDGREYAIGAIRTAAAVLCGHGSTQLFRGSRCSHGSRWRVTGCMNG